MNSLGDRGVYQVGKNEGVQIDNLTPEQRELWSRCEQLWEASLRREPAPIRAALHLNYTGWVTGTAAPHDREAAVASVGPESPQVLGYELTPLAIRVFESHTGVIHYCYTAELKAAEGSTKTVSGRWSEVYVRNDDGEWVMIAVSGGPDGQR
jgi:hypothetical protein